jgi:hypothetical protein
MAVMIMMMMMMLITIGFSKLLQSFYTIPINSSA